MAFFLCLVALLLPDASFEQRPSDYFFNYPAYQPYFDMVNPLPEFFAYPVFPYFNRPPTPEEAFLLSNNIPAYSVYSNPQLPYSFPNQFPYKHYPIHKPTNVIKKPFNQAQFLKKWRKPAHRYDFTRPRKQLFRRLPNKLKYSSEIPRNIPGYPGKDYPVYNTIPATRFNCSHQGYKGPHADTEARCQVWHYCELDGRQHSFLCPNGTVFSQSAYVCDWWHKVDCGATKQLYVLNERLYKYIKPTRPKFPFDFQGPLVDLYIYLKYMEKQRKKEKEKSTIKKSTPPVDYLNVKRTVGSTIEFV